MLHHKLGSKTGWGVGATLALALAGCADDGTATAASATESGSAGSTGATTTVSTTNPGTTTVPTTGDTTSASTMGSVGETLGTTTTVSTSTGPGTTEGTTMDVTATGTTSTSTTSETTGPMSTGTTGEPCAEDTQICDGNVFKVCDGQGGFKSEEMCPDVCNVPLGCITCDPGATQCAGDIAQKCSDDGKMWEDIETCDGLQGVMCDVNAGKCVGACSALNLGTSYIGCDYYPVTLSNLHETQPWNFFYAVVVANTTNNAATVTVTKGAQMITQQMVGPNTAKVIQLPYVDALVKPTINEAGPSLVVTDGSYRLRSNQPVTVYQYEPLDYTINGTFSFTNDASILLPVNTWTGNYIVSSRNHWVANGAFNLPGWYAVVARQDNTKVTIVPSATGKTVFAGGGVAADGTGVVMLNEGDVLEVFTNAGPNQIPNPSDLTGTIINADKPVEVFGGHKCTQVPIGTQACDRLEEAMLPIETLSKKYIITPPLIPTGGNQPKAQMVRVIATEDATTIMYDPVQNGAPTMLAKAGDYFEIAKTVADFEIQSDKKILVSQYMQGQQAGGNSGDPAMTLAVATEQYRGKYLIHAPLSYESNYVNITAPTNSAITLDGAPVAGFAAIGATGFGVARVKLNNNGDGNHTLTGDKPFGVSVYGYGQYTSYWYPGGLDLEPLPQ